MIDPGRIRHPATDEAGAFFVAVAAALLAFTLFAFAQKLAVVPERAERYTPLVIAHGAAMIAWLGLYLVQAVLVRGGRHGVHKGLGALSVLVVAAALYTGFRVSRGFTAESGMIEVFLSNMVQLTVFGGLWAAAIVSAAVGRIDAHRRLMLIATLATLSPPISRVTQTLALPNGLAAAINVALVMALPILYDAATRGRLHPATVGGLAFGWIAIGVAAAFGLIPALADMVRAFVSRA